MKRFWTEELDNAVAAAHATGKSYTVIAKEMGLSRSAIIGRAKRLRDASGIAPAAPRAHYRDRMPKAIVVKTVKMRVKVPRVVKAIFIAPPAPPSLQLALVDLRLKQCRYIGDDGSYCGQPEHARSFCGHHFALSYLIAA
jgi:hypothetical protein